MTILRILILSALTSIISGAASVSADDQSAEIVGNKIKISGTGASISIDARSPQFIFTGAKALPSNPKAFDCSDIFNGKTKQIKYSTIKLNDNTTLNAVIMLKWYPKENLFRKWVKYKINAASPMLLEEIILDDIDVKNTKVWTHGDFSIIPDAVQSHPIFIPGFFTGIEFPVSSAKAENGRLILAHRPGIRLEPGIWYESRKAIYGIAPKGEEMSSFVRYIEMHRPKPYGFHINYNSWWTSPVPFSEKDILSLMGSFKKNMHDANNVSFDTFAIDMGWSDTNTVWEINKKLFPQEFANIQKSANDMKSQLGLWISPCSAYPGAVDNDIAMKNGYEGIPREGSFAVLCLGGEKYANQFKNRLVDMISKYGIRHIKLDGYWPVCNETDHGHEPGLMSCEKIAEGFIAACQGMRKAAPDIWLEPTCFGYNPSPWWLFYANSLMGTIGDDAPKGRVPCPIYRESYTTARDYFNLQGASLLPNPISAQEVLGIVHQTQEPVMNDAVTSILRGHMFQPVYMNPKFMDDNRWESFSGLLKWARKNSGILQNTVPLIPESWKNGNTPHFTDAGVMPKEVYGFSHAKGNRGLIMLRNTWIAKTKHTIKIDRTFGFDQPIDGNMSVVSIYPEARVYAKNVRYNDSVDIPLAAYETVVLSVSNAKIGKNIPNASDTINNTTSAKIQKSVLKKVNFIDNKEPFGADYTAKLGKTTSAYRFDLSAEISSANKDNRLLLLVEADKPISGIECDVTVNGKMVDVEYISSDAGWSATGLNAPEYWMFVNADIPAGDNTINADLITGDMCKSISAWIWSTKSESNGTAIPNMIPSPELISVDSVELFNAGNITDTEFPSVSEERPISKINGVFMDTIEPKSISQGYGKLERNQSVWEKPLIIAGKPYQRGLGTHAISRIEYDLGGKYSKFTAEAGVDGNNHGTVSFEVWVDGVKKWESGLMRFEDPAKQVDIDIAGAKSLVLAVGDGDNGIGGDHADWCNAMLLY